MIERETFGPMWRVGPGTSGTRLPMCSSPSRSIVVFEVTRRGDCGIAKGWDALACQESNYYVVHTGS
jgi:hypothetical protein